MVEVWNETNWLFNNGTILICLWRPEAGDGVTVATYWLTAHKYELVFYRIVSTIKFM